MHVKIRITGRVQGVFYRRFAFEKAVSLHLKGFVQNHSDGSVVAEVVGNDEEVQLFIEWCHKGSPLSKVAKVCVEEGTNKEYTSFLIN